MPDEGGCSSEMMDTLEKVLGFGEEQKTGRRGPAVYCGSYKLKSIPSLQPHRQVVTRGR